MAASNMTAGKAKKSGKPRKAPKVPAPKPINGNYMRSLIQSYKERVLCFL